MPIMKQCWGDQRVQSSKSSAPTGCKLVTHATGFTCLVLAFVQDLETVQHLQVTIL